MSGEIIFTVLRINRTAKMSFIKPRVKLRLSVVKLRKGKIFISRKVNGKVFF